MVNRDLEDNYYSEEVQKGWKKPPYDGLCSEEEDLFIN
jgi:hypothetical protein